MWNEDVMVIGSGFRQTAELWISDCFFR
jgi:hypothetical protein